LDDVAGRLSAAATAAGAVEAAPLSAYRRMHRTPAGKLALVATPVSPNLVACCWLVYVADELHGG